MKHLFVAPQLGTRSFSILALALPLMAACGGSEVGAGKSCTDDGCDHFLYVCDDGSTEVAGGCDEGGECADEDGTRETACQSSAVATVVTVPAGQEIPEPEVDAGETHEDVDAGGNELSVECVDNVVTPLKQICVGDKCFDGAMQDCTRNGLVCTPDDVMGATCQPPKVGDPCFEDTSLVCGGPTPNGALFCKDGKFEDSGLDCTDVGGVCLDKFTEAHSYVSCGQDDAEVRYAMEDSSCAMEGRHACSFDRTAVLRCEGGHWDAMRHCGDAACKLVHPKDTPDEPYTACANGSATLGDPCDTEGGAYCTNDLSQVIECQAGRLRALLSCSGGQQCGYLLKNSQLVLSCRAPTYAAGDDCHFPEGMKLCDASGMQVLVCSEKVVELDTTCEAGTTCQDAVENGVPTVACK